MTFRYIFFIGILLIAHIAVAKNPIITHMRTADPSVRVWDDGQMWLYCSHDQDDATDYSSMDGYHVFSSYDLVNWEDHGEVLHSRDVSWGIKEGGFMWAPDCAYKDGTYYFYFPHKDASGQWRTGVATSDKPQGPFKDIGRPIAGTSGIDPMCFIDDDGQAYLYFGHALVAKLKDNMTELAESPRKIDYDADNFKEGPYMHKKDGLYYFSWTDWTDNTNQGYYAVGDNPYGPFDFMGPVNAKPPGAQDHHSIVEYHGQWYYFYHVGNYNNGSAHRRNVCVDYLYYNNDGTMQMVKQTTTGVEPDPIGSAEAHRLPGLVQAEHYFRAEGVDVQKLSDSLTVVSSVNHGDWLEYVLDIFATEQYDILLKVKTHRNSTLNIRVDDEARQEIEVNSSSDDWHELSTTLQLNGGRHTITFEFDNESSADDLMLVDWINFVSETTYYTISATSSDGGDISPSGELFVKQGGAAEFQFNNHPGFKIETIVVDGFEQASAPSYTFSNVENDHTIHAGFAACDGSSITPYVQKNNEEKQQSASISAYIGETIVLSPETGAEGEWTWEGPGGESASTREFILENAQIKQTGSYTVYFNNEDGCKSMQNFDVSITYEPLDVYDAANFTAQNGIQTESTADVGGGQNIGYIHNGDWAEYEISLEQTGDYYLYYRVATGGSGGSIVASIDGNTLAIVPVSTAKSNGWQDWYTTDSTIVQFDAGIHTLRLTFTGSSGFLFNVNWFAIDPVDATGIDTGFETVPRESEISSIYPNPFNPNTHIKYHVHENADVTLKVMNAMGQTVRTLVEHENREAGHHVAQWDGKDSAGNAVASNIYFVVLAAGSVKQSQKLVLLR